MADGRGRILGASILGANGGEMISEYALAMRHGLRLSQVADTIHPYPTYMLGNHQTADKFVAKQLDSLLLALLGRVLRYRGQRRGSGVLKRSPGEVITDGRPKSRESRNTYEMFCRASRMATASQAPYLPMGFGHCGAIRLPRSRSM